MLAAERQVLDAHLRNELQNLRLLEINNIVNRFEKSLTPATLIAGFCFAAMAELEVLETERVGYLSHIFQAVFYISAIIALALSLLVLCVSTMGIVFAQRLGVQATAEQSSSHTLMVAELNSAFVSVLIALALSMVFVLIAALAMVWTKDPSGDGDFGLAHTSNWVAIVSSVMVLIIGCISCCFMYKLYARLHTHAPADSNLNLVGEGNRGRLDGITEFCVAGNSSCTSSAKPSPQSTRSNSPRRSGAAPPKSKSFGSLCNRQGAPVAVAPPNERAPLVGGRPAPPQRSGSIFSAMGGAS